MIKLYHTLQIVFILARARTFGKYRHSGSSGNFEYALYEWRGNLWAFPLGPYEDNIDTEQCLNDIIAEYELLKVDLEAIQKASEDGVQAASHYRYVQFALACSGIIGRYLGDHQ